MTHRSGWLMVFAGALLWIAPSAGILPHTELHAHQEPQVAALTYEAFTALPPEGQRTHFDALTDPEKAVLLRHHVDAWLAQNRSRLSGPQIALVQELGDLMVQRFDDPNALQDPEFTRRGDAMFEKLKCGLLESDAWEVLGPMVPTSPRRSLWEDLRTWLEECIVPAVR